MTRRATLCLLAVVALVTIAGCSALGGGLVETPEPELDSEGSLNTSTGERGDDTEPTDDTGTDDTDDAPDSNSSTDPETAEPAIDPANPYGTDTLVVGLNDSITPTDVRPAVRDALDFWDANAEQYAGYDISYELDPNASDPDVLIDFDESVSVCGFSYRHHTVGCAPLVTDDAPDTVTIRIEAGYTANSTRTLVKHELGHTLGLDHDDEPQAIMTHALEMTPTETTVEMQLAWLTFDHDRDVVREQVNQTIDYYEQWSLENLETNVTVEISERSQFYLTDVDDFYLLVDQDSTACDGDEACLSYSEGGGLFSADFYVRTAAAPDEAHGWIVGHYLGQYLGLDTAELPERFQDE